MVHRLSSRIGLKKEHLALDEVATILRRINTEKREADRQGGRREHKFFMTNGSKIPY
jgi:hypothetical protein